MSIPIIRDGIRYWYFNKKLHRVDGPAVEFPSGIRKWYLNDELHRTDGPAVEYPDGTKEWYLDGEFRTEPPTDSYHHTIDEKCPDSQSPSLDDLLAEINDIKDLANEVSSIHARVVERLSNVKNQVEKLLEKA